MRHSLTVLDQLYEHDDFMMNLKSVVDMGAGDGHDALWWATRQTRDDEPMDLNIQVKAVEPHWKGLERARHKNIEWMSEEFSATRVEKDSVDLIWCYDSFQFSTDPLSTLAHWHSLMKIDGLLCISVPCTNLARQMRDRIKVDNVSRSGVYFNYTLSNLILMLASSGFDCKGGHFKMDPDEPWLHAMAYKTAEKPSPKRTWYELLDKNILPPSAEKAILERGHLRDSDLVVEWIDHNIYDLSI